MSVWNLIKIGCSGLDMCAKKIETKTSEEYMRREFKEGDIWNIQSIGGRTQSGKISAPVSSVKRMLGTGLDREELGL